MSSNFFTRPFGLHPTPQICFPPPPPKPVGNNTWFFSVQNPMHLLQGTASYHLEVKDFDAPPGAPIAYTVAMPGCLQPPHPGCPNFGQINPTIGVIGPPGNYHAILDITWTNGSHSHTSIPYTILFV